MTAPPSPLTGVDMRLGRLRLPGTPILILTLDGLLIYPSQPRNSQVVDLATRWAGIEGNAVMAFVGTLVRLAPDHFRIANLTASTTGNEPSHKVQTHSVLHAVRHGADAVAAQIHLGASREQEMLSTLGHIVEDADTYGMPVLGIAYPRRDSGPDLKGVELAAAQVHAARVAVELGVHLVKVQMLDDPGAMREIVEACAPVPVLVAGGHLCDAEEWKGRVENSLSAGVSGVCVGRNVTDRPDSLPILEFLHNLRSR